jgi:tetratricopeptide (TPR) repeat protein
MAASAYIRGGFVDESIEVFDRGIRQFPKSGELLIGRISALERAGRNDQAKASLDAVIQQGLQGFGVQLLQAKLAIKENKYDEVESLMRPFFEDTKNTLEQRTAAAFKLVKIYDTSERYDEAYEVAQELFSAYPPKSLDPFRKLVEVTISNFTARKLKMWRRASQHTEIPVFIVGMPRSGTSLIEQILGMHSEVSQAGELSASGMMLHRVSKVCDSYHPYPTCLIDLLPENANELQDLYLKAVEPYRQGASRVTNKALINYENLGLISLTMPNAKAIHIKRHPLDNCLSCQLTELILNGHDYVVKQETLGEVYLLRQKLWRHWQEVLEIPMLEVPYEALTAAQEHWSRRLIEHIGLPFEDQCLDFHKSKRTAMTISYDQVNKKMYRSSVDRWRNYEKHLGPLIDILGDEVDRHNALVEAAIPDDSSTDHA